MWEGEVCNPMDVHPDGAKLMVQRRCHRADGADVHPDGAKLMVQRRSYRADGAELTVQR